MKRIGIIFSRENLNQLPEPAFTEAETRTEAMDNPDVPWPVPPAAKPLEQLKPMVKSKHKTIHGHESFMVGISNRRRVRKK